MDRQALTNGHLDAVLCDTAHATGLPNEFYTDEQAAVLEREHVFGRSWACIGRASDVPRKGELLPVELYGLPLVLLRDSADQVRVFHNVCSHRQRFFPESVSCDEESFAISIPDCESEHAV